MVGNEEMVVGPHYQPPPATTCTLQSGVSEKLHAARQYRQQLFTLNSYWTPQLELAAYELRMDATTREINSSQSTYPSYKPSHSSSSPNPTRNVLRLSLCCYTREVHTGACPIRNDLYELVRARNPKNTIRKTSSRF